MKNVSSSGRLIQNLSEDEGSLKYWKFYMSSIMRQCLVVGILGDFPFLLGCTLGQVITTTISVGGLVLVFFMVQQLCEEIFESLWLLTELFCQAGNAL